MHLCLVIELGERDIYKTLRRVGEPGVGPGSESGRGEEQWN